jgi:hypothetical protein
MQCPCPSRLSVQDNDIRELVLDDSIFASSSFLVLMSLYGARTLTQLEVAHKDSDIQPTKDLG